MVEYHIIVRYHLMIILFLIDELCLVFQKERSDTFREHSVNCRELSSFKYLNKFVKGVLFDKEGVSMKK